LTLQTPTIEDLLQQGCALFDENDLYFGHGTDNSWDEAVYLLSAVLDLPPQADRSLLSQRVTHQQQEQILALYAQRIKQRVPAPYLTQQAWFCSLPFYVDQRLLFPARQLLN